MDVQYVGSVASVSQSVSQASVVDTRGHEHSARNKTSHDRMSQTAPEQKNISWAQNECRQLYCLSSYGVKLTPHGSRLSPLFLPAFLTSSLLHSFLNLLQHTLISPRLDLPLLPYGPVQVHALYLRYQTTQSRTPPGQLQPSKSHPGGNGYEAQSKCQPPPYAHTPPIRHRD